MRDRYGHSDQHRNGVGRGTLGIVIGARLSEGMRETAMNAIGLVTVLVGIQSFLRFENPLVPLVSVIVGLVIGELIGIDDALQRFGDALERRLSKGGVLLLGLGFVLLSLKKVRVANMLPELVVAPLHVAAAPLWPL